MVKYRIGSENSLYGFPEEDPHCQRLIMLAGDDYIEPLLKNNVFEPFPWKTMFLFQDLYFDGNGEQMQRLKEEAEFYEETRNRKEDSRQSNVSSYIEPE